MNRNLLIIACATAVLSGCGKGDQPQGQVAATVAGKEITVAEVSAEAAALGGGAGAQAAALDRLIVRQLLVNEARDRKIDKQPQSAMLVQQAQDGAMVQALTTALTAQVPKVSDSEVEDFIRNNPANISRRKFLLADQIVIPSAVQDIDKSLEPLHSLGEVETMLNQRKVNFTKAVALLDTQALEPQQAKAVLEIGGSDIFFSRNNSSIIVSSVALTRDAPLEGDDAKRAARSYLTQQRVGAQLNAQLGKIIAGGKDKVKFNPAYEPKKPAKK